jgi:hypothetical protein
MSVFEKALGQYRLYHTMLNRLEPQRVLYLAIRNEAWQGFFQRPAVQDVLTDNNVLLIVFDEQREEILQWIK